MKTRFPTLLALMAFSAAALAEQPQFENPRIMLPPPGAKVTGGFMMVNNPGDEPLELLAATSDVIPNVELHLTTITDGVAKMEEQPSIVVGAGESLEFKRGSYHLMFMDLEQPLEEGQIINVTLQSNQGPIEIAFPVEKIQMHDMKKGGKPMMHGGEGMKKPGTMGEPMNGDMPNMTSQEPGEMQGN